MAFFFLEWGTRLFLQQGLSRASAFLVSGLVYLYTLNAYPFTYFSEIIPLLEIIVEIMKNYRGFL